MTIPRILNSIGWSTFLIAFAFILYHSLNLLLPNAEFGAQTRTLGVRGYVIAVPVLLFGAAVGTIGFFGERINTWRLNRNR